MRRQRSGIVAKTALVAIAGVLVFGIGACGPRENELQRGARVGESVSLLGATGPSVSPEIEVDERVLVPSAGWRYRIGAGATSHIVAFQDVADDFNTRSSLFGVRVGFDGTILDSLPFPISSESGPQGMPKIAFNGTDWLVAWRDGRVMFEEDIYAARVAQDGTVRDPNGIAVATGTSNEAPSSVASDGTDFLVTWNLDGVQAAIVRASGVVEPSFTVQAGPAGGSAVAFNGTHYLVAYCESVAGTGYIRAKRLTREGDEVGSMIEVDAGCGNVEIASDGTDWLVAYFSNDGVTSRAVAADGTLGPPGSTIAARSVSITWGGSSYWFTGESSSPPTLSVRVARLDRLGNELDSQIYDEQRGFQNQIAFGGSNAFVSFVGESYVARGSRVNENLEWLDTPSLVLSLCESWQGLVRSAWGGSEHLVVWWEGGDPAIVNDDHLAARRVGANGTPLGSRLEIPSASNYRVGADVASNGNGYLVAWLDEMASRVLATRVSPTGNVLDPASITVSPERPLGASGFEPAVASNGIDYYVVWRENDAARGVRVLADGSIPTGPVTISHSRLSSVPVVGFNGSRYLVAWSDDEGNVRASRVSSAGAVLDASDLALTSEHVGGQPQIASDGTDWFVVWLAGSLPQEIRGARVGAEGDVKDRPAIIVTPANPQNHSVAWTGKEYLVAWLQSLGDNNYALEGRRVSARGRLLDSSAFPISTVPYLTYQDTVDVAGQGAGRALLTYSRWDTMRPIAPRAKARTFTSDLPEGGEGGGASDGGAGAGGAGGSGGTDGGEAGQSSGAGGEAQGGTGRGGASGNGPDGGTAATNGGDSSGEAGDGSGRGSGRVVTEGCGCRVPGGRSNGRAVAIALALTISGFAFQRRKRRVPLWRSRSAPSRAIR